MTEPVLRPRVRSIDPTVWSFRMRAGASVVAGLLLNVAFAPLALDWMAPIAFAVLVIALRGARGWRAFGVGAAFGVAFIGPIVSFLWISAGVLAWVAVTLLQALWFSVAGFVCARADRARLRLVAIPLAWTAVEILRARYPLGGFTWGDAGLTQVTSPLNGYAPFGGVHLVGALVVLFGVALADVVMRRAPVSFLGLAVAVLAVGSVLPPMTGPVEDVFEVAAVQGSVPRDQFRIGRGREGPEDEVVVRNHLAATRRLVGAPPPDLVVWPENSFDRDPRDNPELFTPTKRLIAEVGAPFLIGAIMDAGERFTNSNLHIAPDGTIIGRYDKMHLVPFGEYVPASFFRRLVPILDEELPRDGEPGDEVVVFNVNGAQVGSVICFESTYPALVRRFVSAGAEVLVVTTNNASFGTTPAAAHHLNQSRMRAMENGRAVVHAAIAGISAIISPDGGVVEHAPLFTRDVLRAEVPLHRGLTPYARWGGVIEMLLLLTGLALAAKPRRA